ncbi:MAG: nucleotidyltransferase family protein [Anaerolineae bacterium]
MKGIQIISILLRYGAQKIILYGSLARRDYKEDSDIDICYEGMPSKYFFQAVADCLMNTDRRVSILDFKDVRGYLKDRILMEGRVLYESSGNI